jgi:DNA repair exonuclease SbcCD ATPase subunit
MIIESIELEHVGIFRNKATIGPLRTGINVLAAPNETGKSTFVRAAARALFDKHTCKDDEIRSLQPAGSELSPQVGVVFEQGGNRYRVEKRFLSNPESRLSEWRNNGWQLLADGDAADERVQNLLQSSVPGRGATKAAHWGMLGFLWARQGEASEWPSWEGDTGQMIQTRLVRVEIDPKIERLRDLLWENYSELFTSTGRAKARGPLDQLDTQLEKVEADLKSIAEQRLELESLQRQFSELGPRLGSLEQEVAVREQEANTLRAQASQAELAIQELQQRQGELDVTKEKLEAVNADLEQLAKWSERLKDSKSDLTQANEVLNDASAKEEAAKKRVEDAQQELDEISGRVKELNDKSERTANLLKLKRGEAAQTAMEKLVKKAATQNERVREFRAQIDKLPTITPAKLKKLQEFDEAIRENEAKLEAIGLTVELRPDATAKLTVERDGEVEKLTLKAGKTEALRAAQNLDLSLSGWGRLRIRSGATELSALVKELEENRESLREQLASVDCAKVSDAETAFSKRRDFQKEMEAAEEKLGEALDDFESLEELQTEYASLERQANSLRETLAPTASELKMSVAELESDTERFKVTFKKEEEAQTAATRESKKRREEVEKCASTREEAGKQKVKLTAEAKGLEEQIVALKGRYLQGMDQTKRDAQSGFVKAEARHEEAKKKLPPDAEKLPERNRRAATAYEEVRLELENRRRDHNKLEGALQTRGAEGLYSKESLLLEQQETLKRQIEALRTKAWAARLAHDLIQFRKQAATRSVLGPLEARLSGTFAEITREAERRVFLDEHLQIAGVGASREAMIAFTHLSQGAKEQLLLCLRLAVAGEVSPNGHKLVVLDDVLVNTDAQRQQRVLDLLQTSANQLQIVILTCHPENYRGVGAVVEIRLE